jgi:hypothetical protein
MNFNKLVKNILKESKDYYGKEIVFTDEDTGKRMKGVVVDPNVVDGIDTEECYGPHITDEWYGANIRVLGKSFDEHNPRWYIVATGAWETCPTQNAFHIVSAKEVDAAMIKNQLSPSTAETFGDLVDEL